MTRTPIAAALALLLATSAAHAQTMNAAQPDQPHASAADTAKHAGTVVVDKTKQAVHATGKVAKKVGHATVAVVKKVGHATAKGAKKAGHAVGNTAEEAKDKVTGSPSSSK